MVVEARSVAAAAAEAAFAAAATGGSSERPGCKWRAGATLIVAIFGCREKRFSTSQKSRVEEIQVAAKPTNIAATKIGNDSRAPRTMRKTNATAFRVRPCIR